jgi:hypothetical protein
VDEMEVVEGDDDYCDMEWSLVEVAEHIQIDDLMSSLGVKDYDDKLESSHLDRKDEDNAHLELEEILVKNSLEAGIVIDDFSSIHEVDPDQDGMVEDCKDYDSWVIGEMTEMMGSRMTVSGANDLCNKEAYYRVVRGKGARGVKGLISVSLIIKMDSAPLIYQEGTLMICHLKGNDNPF